MITFQKTGNTMIKEKYVVKDLCGKVIEKFRYKDCLNNRLNKLEKDYGKLKIEEIENG